jgi:pimeloyl-ACP methyl ester carboxylesterase
MTPLFWSLLLVIAVVDVVVLPPMIVRARQRDMNDAARADAPGQFVRLSGGITHYQWHGPASGQVIVLVHGLSAPSFIFAGLVPILTGAGYRVLTYDLYGRGYSDRPRARQTAEFFARQLDELLQDQMVAGPVTVLGYSMGGAIAPGFAIYSPARVARLILIAPAGFGHRLGGMAGFMAKTPVIGDWLMAVFGGSNLRRRAMAEAATSAAIPDVTARMIRETRFRGYSRSILASLRDLLGRNLTDVHRELAARRVPVLAIWGTRDATIPVAHAQSLAEANPTARNVILDGLDHSLTFTHPDEVATHVLDFMRGEPAT